jgi:hypothetical protein
MKCTALPQRRFIDSGADGRVLEELAVADRFGHACEVLIHHAAGAEVHVADFGVAHLAIRQADVHAAARDQAVRHGGPQRSSTGFFAAKMALDSGLSL